MPLTAEPGPVQFQLEYPAPMVMAWAERAPMRAARASVLTVEKMGAAKGMMLGAGVVIVIVVEETKAVQGDLLMPITAFQSGIYQRGGLATPAQSDGCCA